MTRTLSLNCLSLSVVCVDSRDGAPIILQTVEAEVMNAPVHSHLIITEAEYTSLAERGVIGEALLL